MPKNNPNCPLPDIREARIDPTLPVNERLRLMHQRFNRLQLHHNIHAVAVVLDHFEHAVDLPARGPEQRLDLFTIYHHLMSTTL